MNDPELVARALESVPDRPRWIEARALLRSAHARVFGDEGGFVIRNDAAGGQLAVIVGRPAAGLIAASVFDRPGRELMCAPCDEDYVARHIRGAQHERALLYGASEALRLESPHTDVRLLRGDDALDHLPAELREELDGARDGGELWTAFSEGIAASFAYAYWRTEGQFDISIDTAPEFRRRGLARLAASALIRAETAKGLRPVWGAMASNVASQRLAESLGFTLTEQATLFTLAS